MNIILCTVIGKPVKHSLSPLIHNTLYKKHGIAGKYSLNELCEDELPDFIEYARENLRGFNVTMPYKNTVRDFIDQDFGKYSVNTVLNDRGMLSGYSTDEYGFQMSLYKKFDDFSFNGKKALILGAGSVAKSIACLIKENGGTVTLQNRHSDKAKIASEELGIFYEDLYCGKGLSECDILVNASPLGMIGQKGFTDYSFLNQVNKNALIYDLNYSIDHTGLETEAEKIGLRAMNGLGMLIWQAIKSFSIFNGIEPNDSDYKYVADAIKK